MTLQRKAIVVNLEHQSRKLTRVLNTWLALPNTERSFEGLKDLIVKEQFIVSSPQELAIHLREGVGEMYV